MPFDTTAAILYLPILNFADKFSRTQPLSQNSRKLHPVKILDTMVYGHNSIVHVYMYAFIHLSHIISMYVYTNILYHMHCDIVCVFHYPLPYSLSTVILFKARSTYSRLYVHMYDFVAQWLRWLQSDTLGSSPAVASFSLFSFLPEQVGFQWTFYKYTYVSSIQPCWCV